MEHEPVICESTAPLLPEVRQEAVQNQRQKDRKWEGKRELRAGLRGEGKLISKFCVIYNRHRCMGWKTKPPPILVTVRIPSFWAYESPASPGSHRAKQDIFHLLLLTHTEDTHGHCRAHRRIAGAASLCSGGEPLPGERSLWGAETPTVRSETSTNPGISMHALGSSAYKAVVLHLGSGYLIIWCDVLRQEHKTAEENVEDGKRRKLEGEGELSVTAVTWVI